MKDFEEIQSAHLSILDVAGVQPYIAHPEEGYFSDGQKEHFRRLLKGWKASLELQLKGESALTLGENSVNLPDPIDRATQEEALILDVKQKDRQVSLIQQIVTSLQRLEAEAFGYCQNCDEEIGLKRLEASPTTRLCIDCQSLAEIQQKSGSSVHLNRLSSS